MASEWSGRHFRLLACPLCEYEFDPHEKRTLHFEGHDIDDVPALAGSNSGGGTRAD